MQRQIKFGLIIIAGVLAFTAVNLWSTNRLVTSDNNAQANALKSVIQADKIDAAIRKYQLNLEFEQLNIEKEQLRVTEAQSSANGRRGKSSQPSPSPSAPQVAAAPVYISTGDNSTWPSNYGVLLAGVGAVIAALAAIWGSRKARPDEGDRSRRAPDLVVDVPRSQDSSVQPSSAAPDPRSE
jgi:hypothetical protein